MSERRYVWTGCVVCATERGQQIIGALQGTIYASSDAAVLRFVDWKLRRVWPNTDARDYTYTAATHTKP